MAVSKRQIELTNLLDRAARVYEQQDSEIMSNFVYDRLYDELKTLEEQSRTVLANSPTAHAGYEVLSELPKFRHETPCLSLDKTKSVSDLEAFLGIHEGVLSWKMDGLTVVLTYRNGELYRAVTRGNGEVGEVITANVKVFKNIPLRIDFDGELVIRGEAVINYSDFNAINAGISNPDEKYKNPRNLCSGSVRQLNSRVTAERNVYFFAFSLFSAQDTDGIEKTFSLRSEQYDFLEELGFCVVERKQVTFENVAEAVSEFSSRIFENDFPSDGLVLLYDNIEYGKSLGRTAKFPRDSIAFKWQDETAETELIDVEWSASRTGLINPVAVFKPVSLEGTTVSRASVHNVSVLSELELGIGDHILVYKANMIIPQIAENLTRTGNLHIPEKCPVCGGKTEIRSTAEKRALYCTNPECVAKKIKKFSHFVSRNAMNIDGLSEATIEKFISQGFIHEFADFYRLSDYKDRIVEMDGMGEKSYTNLMESIRKSTEADMASFLYSLGILNVGLANARLICKHFGYDWGKITAADVSELTEIEGVGNVIAESVRKFFDDSENRKMVEELLKYVHFAAQENNEEQTMDGMVFVITGSLERFDNRNELKKFIEDRGGKVASAVSGNTDFLINNNISGTSSKNKKAKELSIPIITEAEFCEKFMS